MNQSFRLRDSAYIKNLLRSIMNSIYTMTINMLHSITNVEHTVRLITECLYRGISCSLIHTVTLPSQLRKGFVRDEMTFTSKTLRWLKNNPVMLCGSLYCNKLQCRKSKCVDMTCTGCPGIKVHGIGVQVSRGPQVYIYSCLDHHGLHIEGAGGG